MVHAIAIVAHVVDDRGHQAVIGLLALMEGADLLFQQVEQCGEMDMVGMPGGKRCRAGGGKRGGR
ncbi:hypothetical protein D3C81_2213450 [compost metagenome]